MATRPSPPPADAALEQLAINVIRGLAMDAPQAANSGHSGTAMALAPLAHVLWTRIMAYDATDPQWFDRDRFVLSNGHASILQYAMLYLTGFGLTLDDLKQFRQWGSRTPGHPEHGHTVGIEVTTGPLGQGMANGVGLALSERFLRQQYSAELCDHYTFVMCGDGCLEEGISHEAASLAGNLGLGRLIYLYDDNHITIDGPTELSYSDDAPARFEAYGFHVENAGEIANDTDALEGAIRRAMAVEDRPSFIAIRSHIGYPSPNKMDTAAAHGDPLGADEIALTKSILGLPADETFWVPDDVLAYYRTAGTRSSSARHDWQARLDADEEHEDRLLAGVRPVGGWEKDLPSFTPGDSLATRQALNKCIKATASHLPFLMAGSADLTGNTGVKLADGVRQGLDTPAGQQLHYGIREHAMGGVMTGMALHGGVLPIGGTFFVFSDYMRGSVRLAALSGAHVIYSWTHDSVGLGQDGPTHQPIEHLAALRAMPGLRLIRPADAIECAEAWRLAVELDGPTALILSRQDLPILESTQQLGAGVARGGYVLVDADAPALTLIGTGSEVHLCIAAAAALATEAIATRVVSLPSWDLFEEQDADYQLEVLGDAPRLSVEAATSFGWSRYADDSLSIDHFGASAPGKEVLEHFGFTVDNVVALAKELLGRE